MRNTLKLSTVIITLAFSAAILTSLGIIYKPTYAAGANIVGTPVPPYHALTLDGKDVSMPDCRGKAV